MDDIKGFTKDLELLAIAVNKMQMRLNSNIENRQIDVPDVKPVDSNLFLLRRFQVLSALGLHRKVSRASWSHDRVDVIIFNAWDDAWDRDEKTGQLKRYPMRDAKHYNLAKSRENKVRGHTRWQHHVDMVLGGHRTAILIMPVKTGSDDPNRQTRGWLPQYVTGEIQDEGNGEFWFHANEVIPI
jgi:hypothetical protein